MNEVLNVRKRLKEVKKSRGLEDYKWPWEDDISVLEESLLSEINTVNDKIEEIETEDISSEERILQHWGTTTTMSASEQTFSYSDLGFPSVIDGASPFSIPWADVALRVYDYDNSSVTLRTSSAGIADLPITIGIELTGYGSVFPDKIYNAVLEGLRIKSDREVMCSHIDSDSLTLTSFAEGIDNPSFVVGIRVSGREELGEDLKYWETNVTMTSDEQEFAFEDIGAGTVDDYVYVVAATLAADEDSKTFYYGDLTDARGGGRLASRINDARISGLVCLENMAGYITACQNTYFTLHKSMAGITMDEAITYWISIRGVK